MNTAYGWVLWLNNVVVVVAIGREENSVERQ